MRPVIGILALFGGTFTLCLFAGCSIENKASEVICVKDQTDICTNCERPEGDTRPYRGRHTCASDGKSFGACVECVPVEEGSDEEEPDGTDFKPVPEPPKPPNNPPIEAACNKKMTLVAGKNDIADQFVYAAVV